MRACPESLSMIPTGFALAPAAIHRIKPPCPLALLRAAGLDLDGWLAGCHWNHEYTFGTGSESLEDMSVRGRAAARTRQRE